MSENTQKNPWTLPLLLLGLIAMALIIITTVPQFREKVQANFQTSEKRVILAKATADFNGKGLNLTVIKVKWKDQIIIEIFPYNNLKEENSMFDRIVLSNSQDAYFSFQNNSTNLAIADVDNDGLLEILVPTYDIEQNARLNTFKLRDDERGFERMGINEL